MIKFLKRSCAVALNIMAVVFTFAPEAIFEKYKICPKLSDEINVVIMRLIAFCVVLMFCTLYLRHRRSICIKGNNYSIKIEYGDLLSMSNCKKVIAFDECFTTTIGEAPSNIKPTSICGQYLRKNPIQDMQALLENAQLVPIRSRSKYQHKERYESGRLVPNGEYLLLAFAKLDEDGLGRFFSYEEFLDCLSVLWKEIDKYYGQKDVCISILGSGLTRIGDASFTQQELLDIIIGSYRLSPYKIKSPYQLHIVCKDGSISLNRIGEND